ncbi:MAG: acyl--CoA ligase, partial [Planctomycetes bacterium]|nr:acyl--CoA ligase [Planctomycetota bacterium]
NPDSPAILSDDGYFHYGWLRNAATAVRDELLATCRLAPGAPVAVMLANSPEYVAAFFGVLLAGGAVVPLPPTLEPSRWEQIDRASQFAALISRAADVPIWADHDKVEPRIVPLADRRPGTEATDAGSGRSDADLAMILFTSGSTGLPKGVMLSHRNLLANTRSILQYLPICHGDRTLVVLPFCHAFGNSILQTHVLSGGTLVLGGSLTFPVSMIQAMQQHRVQSFSAVPEVYGMLLRFARLGEEPLPDLRYMTVAGGGLKPEVSWEVAQRIAPASFYIMYGQSEATARLSYLAPEEMRPRWGSIGRGIPGVELKVADEAGQSVPPRSLGRLFARGENIMLGYWRDPAATAAVLQNGWLDTGDLATRDQDGFIYLHGRSNLLIKIQGHRVHPREIEDVVADRFPGAQVVVLPYQPAGETRLALFLAPPSGSPIEAGEVRQFCLRNLPRHKIPTYIEVLERFPLNSATKVDRDALACRIAEPSRRVS